MQHLRHAMMLIRKTTWPILPFVVTGQRSELSWSPLLDVNQDPVRAQDQTRRSSRQPGGPSRRHMRRLAFVFDPLCVIIHLLWQRCCSLSCELMLTSCPPTDRRNP